MNLRRISDVLQSIIVVLGVFTAACPLYFAKFLMQTYRDLQQPWSSVLGIASGALLVGLLYLVAAVAYAGMRQIHPLLQGIAVVVAVAAVVQAPFYWSSIQGHNLFTNVLAEPLWEMFGRVAIACFCVCHFVVERLLRRQNPMIA